MKVRNKVQMVLFLLLILLTTMSQAADSILDTLIKENKMTFVIRHPTVDELRIKFKLHHPALEKLIAANFSQSSFEEFESDLEMQFLLIFEVLPPSATAGVNLVLVNANPISGTGQSLYGTAAAQLSGLVGPSPSLTRLLEGINFNFRYPILASGDQGSSAVHGFTEKQLQELIIFVAIHRNSVFTVASQSNDEGAAQLSAKIGWANQALWTASAQELKRFNFPKISKKAQELLGLTKGESSASNPGAGAK